MEVGFCVGLAVGALVGDAVGFTVGFLVIFIPDMNALNREKSTVPHPVVGSQPGVAENPCGQQGKELCATQLFFPSVISFVKD